MGTGTYTPINGPYVRQEGYHLAAGTVMAWEQVVPTNGSLSSLCVSEYVSFLKHCTDQKEGEVNSCLGAPGMGRDTVEASENRIMVLDSLYKCGMAYFE